MLSRKPQLLISTKCTAVPHGSYCRAPRVLHPSEYKIVALRLSYINCLFILAFEIFSNTSFYLVLSSVCLRTGAINRAPTPTECTLQLSMHNQCLFHEHVIFTHVHQRLPTCIHCRESIYRARILRNARCGYFFVSFVLFFICAIVSVHS